MIWIWSIFVVVYCLSMLFTGLKDLGEIDNILKNKNGR